MPTRASSETWNIQTPLTSTERPYCSGGLPDPLLAPSEIGNIRYDSDVWPHPQNTPLGGRSSDRSYSLPNVVSTVRADDHFRRQAPSLSLYPHPAYQFREFERLPQSHRPPNVNVRQPIMEGDNAAPNPFSSNQGIEMHQPRLASYPTIPQYAISNAQRNVGLKHEFPERSTPLDAQSDRSVASQSKSFQLSSPTESDPRETLAYPSHHHVMQGLGVQMHNPQPHGNMPSPSYNLDPSAPHGPTHPSNSNRPVDPPMMDTMAPQGSNDSSPVHQYFVPQAERHQVIETNGPAFDSELNRHEYGPGLSVQSSDVAGPHPLGFMHADMALPRTNQYEQQRQDSSQIDIYGQEAMPFEHSGLQVKSSITTHSDRSRTVGSDNALSQESLSVGEPEQLGSDDLELGHEPDERDSPSLKVAKKTRAAFSEDARRETGETRKTGACIRCRFQRSRVSVFPSLTEIFFLAFVL